MRGAEQSLAIVFADISQSTRLYERFGDAKAQAIVSHALRLLSATATEHGGVVIKTIGDEVLCTFAEPEAAVEAAGEMHRAVQDDPLLGKVRMCIRVGVHFGEVLLRSNDVFGDAVNVASRATELAKAEQIVTTRATIGKLPRELRLNARSLGRIPVRGKSEPMDFYEINWHEDLSRLTVQQGQPFSVTALYPTTLLMAHRGRTVEVGPKRPIVYLGRDEQNDIVVMDKLVSRFHASVESRRGKYMLADNSTNGVFVSEDNKLPYHVHRDEASLDSDGWFSLGREADEKDIVSVRFFFQRTGK